MKKLKIAITIAACFTAATYSHATLKKSPLMQIKITNDTNTTIYPLITAGSPPKNCTVPTSIEASGIAVGQSIIFDLSSDCWNAGRVYIGQQPITQMQLNAPLAPGTQYPYQLAEYTFTNNDQGTQPVVDYDFSAVDALNDIPIAIEPIGKTTPKIADVGWIGMSTEQSQAMIKTALKEFSTQSGWPLFKVSDSKMPGAYNLFASKDQINQAQGDKMRGLLTKKWFDTWYDKNSQPCSDDPNKANCQEFQQKVQAVINGFISNYLLKQKKAITQENIATIAANPQDRYAILQNIYGYVPFIAIQDPSKPQDPHAKVWPYISDHNKGINLGPDVIDLLRSGLDQSGNTYPYNNKYVLNPYTLFIHGKKSPNLGLHIYAFSIDDSIGNLNIANYNGIQIDVGSTKSLPNQQPYKPNIPTPPSEYHVNIGSGWTSITGNVCNNPANNQLSVAVNFDQSNSCDVDLTLTKAPDSDEVKFTLKKDAQGNLIFNRADCIGNLCQHINAGPKIISLPAPPA
ncbi:hypothetical protein [Piscirickettsia litoralis]|nr:hypothetical protein [Piscirickettsia litoralis]